MNITVYDSLAPVWLEFQKAFSALETLGQSRNALPRVCFVGRFKTGKSYLINALVGTSVLPHDTDECTAHLVELVHGSDGRASRLNGHDLDAAQETPLTLEQFNKAVDLTRMSVEEKRSVEDAAFRYYFPNPLLASCRLIDTPGFDGPNPEARQRAEIARKQAIQQSSLCVLVLSAGLGEDDMKCIRLIQQHKIPMVVVLNQSDKYDEEQIQEIQEQIISGMEQEMSMSPPFFACSALWQIGSAEDRKAISDQRRDYDDADVAEWHQWDAFVSHLTRPRMGENHRVLLTALRHTFELAERVSKEYDVTRQAETVFLDHLSQCQAKMLSLVGKAVLELAVSAAQSGKPLPWKRLQNFGILPEDLAPKKILSTETIRSLSRLYAETFSEIAEMALEQHSVVLYRIVFSEQSYWGAFLKIDFKAVSELSQTVRRCKDDAAWYSQPLRTDFNYEEALYSLQSRWKTAPDTLESDSARLRTRLAAALA